MRRKNTNSIPMTYWGKGQTTLEYFIIFALIGCMFIPLWTGGVFSKVKDSGKEFFTGSVSRIIGDSIAEGPEGDDGPDVTYGPRPNRRDGYSTSGGGGW